MSIWFDKTLTLEKIKHFGKDFMPGYLDMEWVEIGDDFLKMSMPVVAKTQQPFGFLHGGASCALAETLGSCHSAPFRKDHPCMGYKDSRRKG
jgi:1,4-dihydroxy-2-naphthoyl-CoA hydrolase